MTHDKAAFPLHDMGHGSPFDRGMTLRDYFAAKALQAIVQSPESSSNPAVLAMDAYTLADAMMKARET